MSIYGGLVMVVNKVGVYLTNGTDTGCTANISKDSSLLLRLTVLDSFLQGNKWEMERCASTYFLFSYSSNK